MRRYQPLSKSQLAAKKARDAKREAKRIKYQRDTTNVTTFYSASAVKERKEQKAADQRYMYFLKGSIR